MRQALLVALVVAAGLAVGAAVVVLDNRAPPPSPKPPVAKLGASESPGGADATAALPPPEAAAPAASAPPEATPGAVAAPTPPPAATAEAPPPATAPGSDLPNIDVAPHIVHAVPDTEPPSASVTIVDRNGRTLKELGPSAGLSPTYVPSVGPGGGSSSGRGSTRPLLVPPVANSGSNSRLARALPGAIFNGRAKAVGGATLAVTGRNLRLFGVKLPSPGDRCGLGNGDNRSCNEVARDALAQRLQHYPNVACRVPPGQRGGDPAAVCTDNSGTDLADFLIGQGYALADTNQSFDYFGAENTARANRRGLWRNR